MSKTPAQTTNSRKHQRALWWGVAVLAFGLAVTSCLLEWGGRLLESVDTLPRRADAAVVLEGSMAGERLRLEGAMQLLRQGASGRVLVTLPPVSYWGDPVPPMARRFLETTYGHELADRVDFCDVGPFVDSTLQEAVAIDQCIQQRHWGSVVVVTSNYHTRRAGIIWRRVARKENPALRISVYGVDDPDFQAEGWWRKRLWAKTWLMEFSKLVWSETAER